MSRPWNDRSPAERAALESAFVASHGVELLLDGDPEEARAADAVTPLTSPRVPFADLYSALRHPGPLPAGVAAALRDNPRLRDDFGLLLQRCAHLHVPRAAAAAGRGALRRREVAGFTIRVVESRASPHQVYLLVELPAVSVAGSAGPDRQQSLDTAEDAATPEPVAADSATAADSGREESSGEGAPGSSQSPSKGGTPAQLVVKTATEEFLKLELPPPEARTIRLVMAADDPLVRAVGEPASEIFLL